MFDFEFKSKAVKDLDKLQPLVRRRILEKLKFYSSQKNPLRFAEKLKDYRFGEYRFRVGNYRILFDIENQKVVILKIGHRKDIYLN